MSTVNGGWRGPNIVKDGLVLYLDPGSPNSYFNKSSTIIKDISGNGNNGTLINFGSQTIYNSSNGGSIVFDGSNDYVNNGNGSIFSFGNGVTDSPFSVSTWVLFTSVGGSTFKGIVSKDNGTQREWALLENGSGKIRVFLKNTLNNPNVNQQSIDSTTTYLTNTWYNIVFTYDGRGGSNAADGMYLYTNGMVEVPTNVTKGTYIAMSSTIANLNIGRYSTNYFSGRISNTKIYNKAISAQEVLQNYNALKGRYGL